jgi:hypothetical protein
MTKAVIIGWFIELLGVAIWLYGYFSTGNLLIGIPSPRLGSPTGCPKSNQRSE